MSLCDTRPEFGEVFMLQSACIHKMQTQTKHPVNRQKPDILGNQPQTPFSHSLLMYIYVEIVHRRVDLQRSH